MQSCGTAMSLVELGNEQLSARSLTSNITLQRYSLQTRSHNF